MSKDLSSEPQSFEEALTQLEQIIRSLDVGQTPLETSLKNYEKGIALLRFCYKTLKNAERKIEILQQVDSEGFLKTESINKDEFHTKVEFGSPVPPLGTVARKKRTRKTGLSNDSAAKDDSLFNSEED